MTINIEALVAPLALGTTTTFLGRPAIVVKVRGVKTFRMLGHHPVEEIKRLDDGRMYKRVGYMGQDRRRMYMQVESKP